VNDSTLGKPAARIAKKNRRARLLAAKINDWSILILVPEK